MYSVVTIELPEELAEDASVLLHDEGAGGVEIRDHELLPPPGVPAPPPGRAVVAGYFDAGADGNAIVAAVCGALRERAAGRELRAGVATLPDEDWSQTWKLHFRPLRIADRLWVVPPWEDVPEPRVVIEPGLAFGTGGHATTALCLEGIAARVRPGATVLDVGCGSGVLGIAAAKLGAGRVVLIDDDPVAVQVAGENARRNEVEVEVADTPVAAVEGRFELVVANILANVLTELAAPIAARTGRLLLLSGVLTDQASGVRAAYEAQGLRFVGQVAREGWVRIDMERA